MTVDRLRLDDIPQLAALYDDLVQEKNDPAICAQRYREIVGREDQAVFVARDGGRVVGTAMCIACPSLAFGGRPFLVIEDVIVLEECRGMGIGRLLFAELDAFALERNCSYAILVSSGFRTGAHAFYQKMGFSGNVRGFRKGYGKE